MKGKPWEYVFFVEMEGHRDEPAVQTALQEASEIAASHKVLGSFPRALETIGSSNVGRAAR
jgi:prephenate dehydratase